MLKLYPHNERAYKAALCVLNQSGKAAIIHPTGTGKSFIGFNLAKDYSQKRVLWLTPSDYIVRTQLQNVQDISGWQPNNIQFITYSKLMLLPDSELKALCPDFIILDEFHRCGAERWSTGVQSLLSAYPNALILGLSATNIRYLDNQRDMADELFEGNIASEITLGEAIARNILPAPTYITTVYAYAQELEYYQKRVQAIRESSLREKSQKYLDDLRRALEQADGVDEVFEKYLPHKAAKLILFCADFEHLKSMQEKAKEWFAKIDDSPHIYTAYSDDSKASAEFDAFKKDESGHLKLLFCIDMLNEGVHIAGIDGVVMLRPTVSPIIYKQQLGRALSAGETKSPLIFDIVNNFENLYSISTVQQEAFSAIGKVYNEEPNASVIKERFKLFNEVRDCQLLFETLQKSLCAGWDEHYFAAEQYFRRNRHLLIPKNYKTTSGLSLGSWLTTQRRVKAGQVPGNLDDERIAKLDAIGMEWNSRIDVAWQRNYELAKAYYKQYGSLDIKAQYIAPDGTKLGKWIVNQRQARAGQTLSENRVIKLNEIGMLWDVVNARWESNYAEAAKYYVENGDLNVPVGYKTKTGFALGAWVRNLRAARLAGTNSPILLLPEQIMRLDSIGMQWTDCFEAQWQKTYKEAQNYYSQHKDLHIPATYKTPNGIALGKWLYRQKSILSGKLNTNKLSLDQRQKLIMIGIC